jgi:hypothetical protein
MSISLISLFRDCEGEQIRRWASQVKAFAASTPHSVIAIAVEGDSKDGTRAQLQHESLGFAELRLVRCDVGVPRYPSCEDPARLKALSSVLNAGMAAVDNRADFVIFVESDLIWEPQTFHSLVDFLNVGLDVVAPMIFAGDIFYDTWGFRTLSGHRFGCLPKMNGLKREPLELGSVGSCLAMRAEVARRCRVSNDLALVGWCEDVRRNGFHIFVAPTLSVRHPA